MSIGSVPKYIMKIVIYIENKNLFCVKIFVFNYSKGTYILHEKSLNCMTKEYQWSSEDIKKQFSYLKFFSSNKFNNIFVENEINLR